MKWRKKNADKIKEYSLSDEGREKNKINSKKYRDKNKKKYREYIRDYNFKKIKKELGAKIICENVIERRFGWRYWIDKEGNLCGSKVNNVKWSE